MINTFGQRDNGINGIMDVIVMGIKKQEKLTEETVKSIVNNQLWKWLRLTIAVIVAMSGLAIMMYGVVIAKEMMPLALVLGGLFLFVIAATPLGENSNHISGDLINQKSSGIKKDKNGAFRLVYQTWKVYEEEEEND